MTEEEKREKRRAFYLAHREQELARIRKYKKEHNEEIREKKRILWQFRTPEQCMEAGTVKCEQGA